MTRVDSASRTIAASPSRVFWALTDEIALAVWLPPGGMSARFDHADLRPGGSFRMVLTYDDPASAPAKSTSDSDIVQAQILDLVPDRRVVWAVEFESEDPAFAGTMTMTWDLHRNGASTRVGVRAEQVPPGISPEDHREGMASSLDNLESYLRSAS